MRRRRLKPYRIIADDDSSGLLVTLLGLTAGLCFLMATSIYCDWPFSRGEVTSWVARTRVQIHEHLLLHARKKEATHSEAGTLSTQWSQVDLRFNLVEAFLTEDNCQQSRKNLVACVAVVNRMLEYGGAATEFVPGPAPLWARLLRTSIVDFGFSHIRMRRSNLGADLRRVYEHDKKQREEYADQWAQMRLLHESMPFEQVVQWLRRYLVVDSLESEITAVAYNTYLSIAKDPHSQIVPLSFYKTLFGQGSKKFTGVGVELRRLGDTVYISDITDGTPAQRAGVAVYDIVLEVNEQSIVGLALHEIYELMQEASPLTLKVSRAGQTLNLTFALANRLAMRDMVSSVMGSDQGLLGYVKINRFATGVCKAVRSSLEYFNHNDVHGVILDLRGNGGGDLGEGVCVTSLFLDKDKPMIRIENLLGPGERNFRTAASAATALPLFVLINARTASASEIVAGVLQEHHRALVLGSRSFGKGTTQMGRSWSRNPSDPDSKKFIYLATVGRFLLPSGYSIQIHGVVPDIEVYSTPHPSSYDRFAIREEDHLFYVEPTARPQHRPDGQRLSLLPQCQGVTDEASARFDQLQKAGLLPDYILISATQWAHCLRAQPVASTPTQSPQSPRLDAKNW